MTIFKYRSLVSLTFLILLMSYVITFIFNQDLVNFVSDFSESLLDVGRMRSHFFKFVFLVLLFLLVYSCIGLLLLKNSARYVFLIAFTLIIPLHLLLGVSVQSGLSRIFYDTGLLFSGGLLTLIFTDPTKYFFRTS